MVSLKHHIKSVPAGIPEYVHAMVNTFQQFNVAVNDVMAQFFGISIF